MWLDNRRRGERVELFTRDSVNPQATGKFLDLFSFLDLFGKILNYSIPAQPLRDLFVEV